MQQSENIQPTLGGPTKIFRTNSLREEIGFAKANKLKNKLMHQQSPIMLNNNGFAPRSPRAGAASNRYARFDEELSNSVLFSSYVDVSA